MNPYGEIVEFVQGEPLVFKDFTLTYQGKKTLPGPNQARFTMKTYYFQIKTEDTEWELTWSSGTGRIAPKKFEVGKDSFTLELKYELGLKKRLEENELVVTWVKE